MKLRTKSFFNERMACLAFAVLVGLAWLVALREPIATQPVKAAVEETRGGETLKTNEGVPPKREDLVHPLTVTDDSEQQLVRDTPEGWALRRKKAENQRRYQKMTLQHDVGRSFFQENWEPTFACAYEQRLGKWGDGGKWVCDPHRISRPALIYSLGSWNEFSFEEAVRDFLGNDTEIHTFDYSAPARVPPFIHYHQWRLAGSDGKDNVKSFKTVLRELGHENRVIHILKVDIEGSEYDVLIDAVRNGAFANVQQLLIEFHLPRDSRSLTPAKLHEFIAELVKTGLEIFHKEPNIQYASGDVCEYAFVRVRW